MYLLARDGLSRAAATVAALLYLLAPYHLVDMLVRHALGEHLAFAWIPLAVWGVAGGVRRPGAARIAVGALAVAALPLTHNITALFALALLIAWAGLEAARARSRSGALRAAFGLGLGLALSAFFWLPAFAERGLVPARERLTSEFYRYALHFVAPRQLVVPSWGFGGSAEGVASDDMSFQIGLVHLALVLAAVFALALRLRAGRLRSDDDAGWLAIASLAVFAAATFMTTAASRAIWDAIPLLAYAQFPWRWLTLAALGASLAGGFAIDALLRGVRARALGAAAAILCAVLAYGGYAQPRFAVFDRERSELLPATDAEARTLLEQSTRYEDPAARATLATLVATGQSGANRHEYLPATVARLPTQPPVQHFEIVSGSGRLEKSETLGPNHERATILMESEGELGFQQFMFEGWRATIDGGPAQLRSEWSSGLIRVTVPAGRHTVEVAFTSTLLRDAANTLSAMGLVVLWLTLTPSACGRVPH
jgi:hypothetical protein